MPPVSVNGVEEANGTVGSVEYTQVAASFVVTCSVVVAVPYGNTESGAGRLPVITGGVGDAIANDTAVSPETFPPSVSWHFT
jgi:hypothetical protein